MITGKLAPDVVLKLFKAVLVNADPAFLVDLNKQLLRQQALQNIFELLIGQIGHYFQMCEGNPLVACGFDME